MTQTGGKARSGRRSVSNRAKRRLREERQSRTHKLLIFAVPLGIALVVAVGLILISQQGNKSEPPVVLPSVVAAVPIDNTIPSRGRTLGDPNAPVTLTEWADYQCPACKAFGDDALPAVIEEYVKTGKVKIEYRDFPFLDDRYGSGESDMPAEAAACAADQGKFWQMHDTIYANQFGENQGSFSERRLKAMAQLAGLDTGQFNACFDAGTYEQEVQAMKQEAERAGVTFTPTIMLNGVKIAYTGRYEDLKADIEAALAS